MEKQWKDLSADEKQEAQFQKLLAPKDPEGKDFKFQSPETEKLYKERITRIKDAIQLKKLPDRVPVCPLPNMFPYKYAGLTIEEGMYDYDKCVGAFKKYVLDMKPDMHIGASGPGPGKFYEILDYKLYAWAGHGVSPTSTYQCHEGEYMKAEEYDILINDPTFFFSNVYLPRVFGALQGWTMLPLLPGIVEMYGVAFNFIPFALPPVQNAYKALFEAGAEALKWAMAMGGVDAELKTLGYPNILGGFTKAPFDIIGDTLRGSRGIMTDMYRRPDKLLAALEALTPIMINMGVGAARHTGNPLIFMPLHKGADGFMSDEQFKKFYWPTFKQVMLGLIGEGCIPLPAAEGGYNSRLEIIKDVPKGKILWMFDETDLIKAKSIIGDRICILGNVPSSMLVVGTTQDVKNYCKKLIDNVGKGGGYIVGNGAFFDEANPENVKAMIDFTKEYGVYK